MSEGRLERGGVNTYFVKMLMFLFVFYRRIYLQVVSTWSKISHPSACQIISKLKYKKK